MKRRLAQARGFTLIEISIVITIMMILLSISAPGLRRFAASSKLKSSAKAMRSLLNYARDVAITENEGYLVVFDLETQEYWLVASSEFDPEEPRTVLTEGVDLTLATGNTAEEEAEPTQTQSDEEQANQPTRTSMVAKIVEQPHGQVRLATIQIDHGTGEVAQPIETGIDYLYFGPNGRSEDMELYLQDTRGKAIQLNVTQATARVRIGKVTDAAALGLDTEELE